MSLRRIRTVGVVLAVLGAAGTAPAFGAEVHVTILGGNTSACTKDWQTYGASAQHTFNNATCLSKTNVHTLAPKWFFKTGDAVTANPVVVGNRVYVGSWDGNFYAIDKETGAQVWKYGIKPQPAIVPREDANGRKLELDDPESYATSDGGLITSSAWYEHASPQTHGRNLVIFGGGFTLYALDADTGQAVWSHDYTARPELPADPEHDEGRIFSSPVVVGTKVIFGVTSDGQNGHRGYVAAANIENGEQVWRFETDVDPNDGHILNDGCGGVWSSGTPVADHNIIVFDVADCDFNDPPPFNESVFALHTGDGTLAWNHRPSRVDDGCDWDFGATPNYVKYPDGSEFLGVGGKDGTYYRLDPLTGDEIHKTNVVFGGLAGGFLGTPAFDGTTVYGATALGDFGRFEGFGALGCEFPNPQDGLVQEPSIHAIDGATGAVKWQGHASQSFGPTVVAGGMTFVGTGIARSIQIRDADSGLLIHTIPLPAPSDSGIIPVGKSIFFGTGSSEQSLPVGVWNFTAVG